MSDRLAVLAQYLLPKQALTVLAGKFASARLGGVTTAVIRRFVARYGVDMAEAANPDIASYPSFNEFFTRPLKPGARPMAAAELVCPVDGAISQFGAIERDQIFQAKGHRYTTTALVGGDAALAAQFDDGHFATLYLSPKDYHRIHMPCAGRLLRMIHVPGDLFSVNPARRAACRDCSRATSAWCACSTADSGPFVLVLVGATIVGSMATVWHGVVNPPRPGTLREWRYDDQRDALQTGRRNGPLPAWLDRGDAVPERHAGVQPGMAAAKVLRMGEVMGNRPR